MKKKNHSVGFFSSYYRGAECLLQLWPKIREQVPDATLDIYYGWESYLAIKGEDAFYERMLTKFDEMKDQGVTEHGRVSHEELAKIMQRTQVWTYPTEFPEIFCITAVKANAAHTKPVVTEVAALKETAGPIASRIKTRRIYFDEYAQKKFVDAVVEALNNPLTEDDIKQQAEWVKQWDWSNIAKQWSEVVDGR